MSKMDELRKMREARYAADQARAKSKGTPARRAGARPPVAPEAAGKPSKPAEAEEAGPGAADALCGHRNMSGRTCTREQGHAAKSHRYS